MSTTPDRYDRAIAYLTEHPEQIQQAWSNTGTHLAGCLFAFVRPVGGSAFRPDGEYCGCLTTIRSGEGLAWTGELTEAIRADENIPQDWDEITVAHLPTFAAWQRRIDRELGRVWPEEVGQ